jgi:UDP-2-acetamido-3-amino-2,3-dideoxy-glucuronate N-acetyltransferase
MEEKKRICVIGGGRWGQNHIRTLHSLGCLAAVCDSNAERLKCFAESYPDIDTYISPIDAVAARYDGYTVATPAQTHYAIGVMLLEAGLPVLIEKPMTLTVGGSESLVALAQHTGTTLMVGHVLLFHPAYRKIKEVIESGKIGRLFYLYSNRLNLGTVRTEESVFSSFAPHDISLLDYLTDSHAVDIRAKGESFLSSGVCDCTLTQLTYPDNIHAHIFVSWLHPFKQQLLVVVGSEGMLSFDDASEAKEIYYYNKHIDFRNGIPHKVEQPDEVIAYERCAPLEEELRYFISHLHTGATMNSGKAGLEVVRVLETVENMVH